MFFPGRISVDITPLPATLGACSSITRLISPAGATHSARQANSDINAGATKINGVSVYPNPNDGNFVIEVDNFKTSAMASISDITGKQLGFYLLKKGENKIENEILVKGVYDVLIMVDDKTETKKIIIK